MPSFVIAGASLAGAKAAETLRDEGFDGDIVLLGAELERPYERPPLSKGYLLGNDSRDSVYVHAAGWYAEHAVDLREGVTVTAIDRGAATVATSGPTATQSCPTTSCCSPPARRRAASTFPGSDRRGGALPAHAGGFRPAPFGVPAGHPGRGGRGGWIGLETAAAARSAELPGYRA